MKFKELFCRDIYELGWRVTGPYSLAALLFGFDFIYLVDTVRNWAPGIAWSGENGPAWVQAIGTIFAIAVAVFVPLYQRSADRREKASDHLRLELAQSERLSAICSEVYEVVGTFDEEVAFADYQINNSLRRYVLNDLLKRLNEAQKADTDAVRLKISVSLRYWIHNWLKFFDGNKETEIDDLHRRVELMKPSVQKVKIDAENVVRRQKGLPLLEFPVSEDDK